METPPVREQSYGIEPPVLLPYPDVKCHLSTQVGGGCFDPPPLRYPCENGNVIFYPSRLNLQSSMNLLRIECSEVFNPSKNLPRTGRCVAHRSFHEPVVIDWWKFIDSFASQTSRFDIIENPLEASTQLLLHKWITPKTVSPNSIRLVGANHTIHLLHDIWIMVLLKTPYLNGGDFQHLGRL